MDINNQNSVIRKFLKNDENIITELYLMRKTKNLKDKYQAKELVIKNELMDFLKQNLREDLEMLMEKDEFKFSDYNDELEIKDNMAVLKLEEFEKLNQNYKSMRDAIEKEKLDEKNGAFQFLKLIDCSNDKECIICYYQGIKKVTNKKKRFGFIEENDYQLLNKNLLVVGGVLDFIIDENDLLYIYSSRQFEWAFDYHDHIVTKRDLNLSSIKEKDIFENDDSFDYFNKEAEKYIRTRSMAAIDNDVVENLKIHFEKRCDDLIKINNLLNSCSSENEKTEIKKRYGIVIDLLEFIDLDSKKIRINEENKEDLNPIFYLIQNKIVETFLTKSINTSLGYSK